MGRGRRRGWPPEPQAQASKEMVVSWNVPVSSPHPRLGLCENYVRANNRPQGLGH